MLHVRVDATTKEQAAEALEAMGLTMSTAVQVLLRRIVACGGFPLELKVPNKATRAAMKEARAIIADRKARFETAEDLFDALEETK
jgi:DNA-damage-inducible protein J